jgi:hypothetical protein
MDLPSVDDGEITDKETISCGPDRRSPISKGSMTMDAATGSDVRLDRPQTPALKCEAVRAAIGTLHAAAAGGLRTASGCRV